VPGYNGKSDFINNSPKTTFMKKLFIYMIMLLLPFFLIAGSGAETTMTNSEAASPDVELASTDQLVERIETINDMDKSELTRAEKKELRKEVRSIEKELKQRNGIYISVGGLIVILLLILIFR
jgi:hypothetical protein